MKSVLFSSIYLLLSVHLFAIDNEINLGNIEIIRDEYGVPHIFSETNREAIYGLAWAQCEDNFDIIQDNFAITNKMGGRLMGKDGAVLDYIYQVFEIENFVETRYDQDIDSEMENLLIAYTDAINRYAKLHPEEVKRKKLFPLTPKQILGNHILHFLLMHSSAYELGKLLTKKYDYLLEYQMGSGSNAMAYSPNITTDQKTYLVGNPHQPINDMGNFWEVSVHSKEGYEMYGATLSVGGIVPFVGANRNLGWAHTTNYQNSADVYELEMHPSKKNFYKYDGEWKSLEVKKAKLKVKIGFIVLPVKRKYYRSVYGPTFKKKSGYYSFKSHVFYNVRAPEQWYKMGLAKNFEAFSEALNIQGLPGQTITYADKDENIYHLSNFTHPYRNENIDWSNLIKGNTTILDGTTSKNNWQLDSIYPVKALAQVKNPACGYVYNCNNTVFKMTGKGENPKPESFPKSFGMLSSNTVRAKTFENLIDTFDKVSFADVRKIRENGSIDQYNMSFRNCMNCNDIPRILKSYPSLKEANKVFEKWNGEFTIDNRQAPLIAISSMYFTEYIAEQFGNEEKNLPEEVIVNAIFKAQKFLLKHYGTLEVELGEVQKAVRYGVEYPMYGGPNCLANAHFEPYKKGKIKVTKGDSYVFYAKFGKDGLEEMNTINAFGNSLQEGHPHSTDQTQLYVKKKTKPIELDLEKLKSFGKIYHPK